MHIVKFRGQHGDCRGLQLWALRERALVERNGLRALRGLWDRWAVPGGLLPPAALYSNSRRNMHGLLDRRKRRLRGHNQYGRQLRLRHKLPVDCGHGHVRPERLRLRHRERCLCQWYVRLSRWLFRMGWLGNSGAGLRGLLGSAARLRRRHGRQLPLRHELHVDRGCLHRKLPTWFYVPALHC